MASEIQDGEEMTLVLCHLDVEIMLDIDISNKGFKDIELAAKWLGEEELCRAKLKSAEVVPSIEALPKNWKGALPYREDRSGPELTCDQILLGKGYNGCCKLECPNCGYWWTGSTLGAPTTCPNSKCYDQPLKPRDND
jgi:hypothetical protein